MTSPIVTDAIHKPERDARLYRRVTFPNGLEACLISDPSLVRRVVRSSAIGPIALPTVHLTNRPSTRADALAHDESNAPQAGMQTPEDDKEPMDDDGSEEGSEEGASEEGASGEEDDDDDDDDDEEEAGAGMKLAACSVDFNVGFFSDPESGFEGISHFLEHMVFMGSEKYPGENHFSDWLSKHWGSENACTDSEQTTYYFDCHPKHLREGLDIFIGYFLNPLLKMDAVEREVTAVESEFERVVNNDASRVEAILGHVAAEAHPYKVFGWGNRASLTESTLWKEGKIRDALLDHWRKHYHAGRMSITLLGEQDLDTLQGWVEELFRDMRADGVPKPDYALAGPPYANVLPMMIHTTRVAEGKQLDLVFTVPAEIRRDYASKSTEYVEELLGHEGKGSLFSLLKSKGLADRISAGVGAGGLADTSCAALFTATIKLTDEGYEKVDDVVALFFQYVAMMKKTGAQDWSWNENRALRGIEFRFKEEESAADYTEGIAMTMRRYSHEDVLRGDYLYASYKPEKVAELLDFIAPSACLYVLSDHGFDVNQPGVERERWFNVPFKRAEVCAESLRRWETSEPDAELRYPPRNEYIAENFDIKGGSASWAATAAAAGASEPPPHPLVTPPEIVHECGVMRLWHRLDDKFDQPRVCAYFHVTLPAIEPTAAAYVAADVLTLCVHDSLQDEVRYPAELASLNAGLDVVGQHTMLSFTFDGFNDKLGELVKSYFGAVSAFDVNESRFEKIKEKRLKDLKNYGLKPGRQARSLLHQLLKDREASEQSKIDALERLTSDALRAFARAAWSAAAHVEGLVIGNVTADEACAMGEMIRGTLKGGPIARDAFPTRRITIVPPGDARFATPTQNPEEGTNVVYAYYQHGVASHELRGMHLLVHQLMAEKLFDQLRTKEQLGYVASASLESLYDVYGFRITVESAFHAPKFVEERINAFLRGFPKQLEEMDESEYAKTRRSLVDSVLTMDVSLSSEADRHWTHVTNQKYQFYRGQIIASAINQTGRRAVIDWLTKNLNPDEPSCRRATVFVHGKNHPIESGDSSSPLRVDDVDGLKEKWGLHPAQGDATTVPELQTPPEDMCKLSNTNASEILNAKRASAATGVGNQWARRAAERRAQCAAGCACLKPGGAGPFKLPRLQ